MKAGARSVTGTSWFICVSPALLRRPIFIAFVAPQDRFVILPAIENSRDEDRRRRDAVGDDDPAKHGENTDAVTQIIARATKLRVVAQRPAAISDVLNEARRQARIVRLDVIIDGVKVGKRCMAINEAKHDLPGSR